MGKIRQKHIKYATFSQRACAVILDAIVVTLLLCIVLVLIPHPIITGLTKPFNLVNVSAKPITLPYPLKLWVLVNLLHIVSNYIYSVYFIHKTGATPGKQLVGIHVVDATTHKPPKLLQAVLRETVGKFISGVTILGYIWMLTDKNHQTWHDLLTTTLVIRS